MKTKLSDVMKIGKDDDGFDAVVPRENVVPMRKKGMTYLEYIDWAESLGRLPNAEEWASFHMEDQDEGPQAS